MIWLAFEVSCRQFYWRLFYGLTLHHKVEISNLKSCRFILKTSHLIHFFFFFLLMEIWPDHSASLKEKEPVDMGSGERSVSPKWLWIFWIAHQTDLYDMSPLSHESLLPRRRNCAVNWVQWVHSSFEGGFWAVDSPHPAQSEGSLRTRSEP